MALASTKNYLYLVAGNCAGALYRELKNCGSGSPDEILPEDRVNVGGLGVFPARVLLPPKAAMVRIMELDDKPGGGVPLLLPVYENSPAAVGETIQGVDVMNKDDLCTDLQVQFF